MITHAARDCTPCRKPKQRKIKMTTNDDSDIKICRNVNGLSANPACMAGAL
jgi:hypothetical protein